MANKRRGMCRERLLRMLMGVAVAATFVGSAVKAADGGTGVAASRPNVIVIVADDLGYADLGCQGSGDIRTPNIDRLASEGVRCTSGYVTWPACAPSRAGLITGQDSHRFGFYTNPTPVLAADQGLPPGIATVPGALQRQGYVTGGVGKWHLGTTPDRHPNRMGFTEWFGFLGGGHQYFPWKHYGKKLPKRPWPEWFVNGTLPLLRDERPVDSEGYITDQLSAQAVGFVRSHRDEPFFLCLAYNAPHSPYEAPKDEEDALPLDSLKPPTGISVEARRTYVAMVTRMDKGVGRVLDAVEEAGLNDRTLIFFVSDNGGGANLAKAADGTLKPSYPSSNGSLRGSKGTLYEGGIRVPFLVRWTGRIPAGTTCDTPVSTLDIGATALALAGGQPPDMRIEGVDIMPQLSAERTEPKPRTLFWKLFNRGAIREGRFKLITGENNAKPELYDLQADRDETRNLAADEPDVVRRLHETWKAWNSQMPPPAWKAPPERDWTNPEYQPPLWPEETETPGVGAVDPLRFDPFRFDASPGPQFTSADKHAQRLRGDEVIPLVRRAFETGADSVTIPPGDYRFGKDGWADGGPVYSLDFRNLQRDAKNPFRIVANGVTFWFELPPDQAPRAHFALGFTGCSYVAFEGATLDRDPRGNIEGCVTQIDHAANRVELRTTPGSAIPPVFSGDLNQRVIPFNADGTLCTALFAVQLRPGQLRYQSVEPGSGPGRFWVQLDAKSELLAKGHDPDWRRMYGDAGTLDVGDGLSLVYSTSTALGVTDSRAMQFIGVKVHIPKGGVLEQGGGDHLWKDCYFGPRPGSCHWQGGDGFLSRCLERGSTYDGVTILHTTDDVMNMHGYWGFVEAVDGATVTLQKSHQMPAHPGDDLHFLDAQIGRPVGTARVEKVTGQTLTLDRDASAFAGTIAENRRWQCDGWTIKNCTFTDCYQRLLVQGGNGGVLRDTAVTRLGSSVELRSNFFTKNEGGICRDIRIIGNTFEDVAVHPAGVVVDVGFRPRGMKAEERLVSGIVVDGNSFFGFGKHAIRFDRVKGGSIRNNRFSGKRTGTAPMAIDDCVDVAVDGGAGVSPP